MITRQGSLRGRPQFFWVQFSAVVEDNEGSSVACDEDEEHSDVRVVTDELLGLILRSAIV